MIEQIKQILGREQYYLMYNTGAGGEALTNLITKYSNKFKKLGPNDSYLDPITNRTMIKVPNLWNMIAGVKTDLTNYTDIVDLDKFAQQLLDLMNKVGLDVAQEIADANAYLNDSLPPLIKAHVSFNPYFFGKTYFIVPDAEKWSKYSNYLGSIKMYCDPIKPEYVARAFLNIQISMDLNAQELEKLAATQKYIEENKPETVSVAQILVTVLKSCDMTCEMAFKTAPLELVKKLPYDTLEPSFDDFNVDKLPELAKWNFKIIPFSKIFEPGFLEQMFEIRDYRFALELEQWHVNNTNVLTAQGFEYE